MVNDEHRYLAFANNLLSGFYSPPSPAINLWNGPGYPIIIAVFLYLKSPLLIIKLLNPIFLYLSLILNYKTLILYINERSAIISCIILGFYFPVYETLPFLLTEILSWFLVSLICYLFLKNFQSKDLNYYLLILSGFTIGYLAMTKIIFGYAIVSMFIITLLYYIITKFKPEAKKSFLVFLFAFLFCLPWLFYTFQTTHKVFYWGNSGGMSLYTMSSTHPDELGDWFNEEELIDNSNHSSFIDSIQTLHSLEKDAAYKSEAIKNIKSHPEHYALNWIANIGRLIFSYPFSNTPQTLKSYFTILPNSFVFVLIVFSSIILILNVKLIPEELIVLTIFILVYLFGSSLLSAYRRMFYITIPFWSILITFIMYKFVSIKFKVSNNLCILNEGFYSISFTFS